MPHSTFVIERIKITSKTQSLKLRPTSKDELKAIIEKEIKEQGPDADLNFIDTSLITDMSELFANYATIRNIKIDEWDVSNVTNMSHMFSLCEKFNCDLSRWNTSNVTNMKYMFYSCENFDSDLRGWDVSNVITYIKFADLCSSSFVKKIPDFK
nr:MAG TPA: protein of unknown function DUF285 [Caudoviricetes sp.]